MTGRVIDGHACAMAADGEPAFLLLEPVGEPEDLSGMLPVLRAAGIPFAAAVFRVEDWNRELSPWDAPPVFGRDGFGHGAEETLSFVVKRLIPEAYAMCGKELPVILGGYSLAGLFALWSACRGDCFAGAAGVSPSLWFPGWDAFAEANPPRTEAVYLSLGDAEEKARNRVLAGVGDAVRRQHERLGRIPGLASTLEWNEGNHFREAGLRTAKGFSWCMKTLAKRYGKEENLGNGID